MRLAVVGTKQPVVGLKDAVYRIVANLHNEYGNDLELISGGCRNTDTFAAEFALDHRKKSVPKRDNPHSKGFTTRVGHRTAEICKCKSLKKTPSLL